MIIYALIGILYEGIGIDLYEAITRDPAYYLYNEELSIFRKYSQDIVGSCANTPRYPRTLAYL